MLSDLPKQPAIMNQGESGIVKLLSPAHWLPWLGGAAKHSHFTVREQQVREKQFVDSIIFEHSMIGNQYITNIQ
jgi:hypothetical protein